MGFRDPCCFWEIECKINITPREAFGKAQHGCRYIFAAHVVWTLFLLLVLGSVQTNALCSVGQWCRSEQNLLPNCSFFFIFLITKFYVGLSQCKKWSVKWIIMLGYWKEADNSKYVIIGYKPFMSHQQFFYFLAVTLLQMFNIFWRNEYFGGWINLSEVILLWQVTACWNIFIRITFSVFGCGRWKSLTITATFLTWNSDTIPSLGQQDASAVVNFPSAAPPLCCSLGCPCCFYITCEHQSGNCYVVSIL